MELKPFGVLDMDGVLANFVGAACAVHGHPDYNVTHWDFFKDWGISGNEFWRVIHDLGDSFYADLVKPYPWCWSVLDFVSKNTRDFVIMTAPSRHPAGYAAKKIWCDKYLPKDIKLIVGSEKHLLARFDRVLIDDHDQNILHFHSHGGMVITFPQPWNLAADATSNRLTHLATCLQQCAQLV